MKFSANILTKTIFLILGKDWCRTIIFRYIMNIIDTERTPDDEMFNIDWKNNFPQNLYSILQNSEIELQINLSLFS